MVLDFQSLGRSLLTGHEQSNEEANRATHNF